MDAKVKCLYVKTFDSEVKESSINKWRDDFKKEPVKFFVIPNEDVKQTIFDFMTSQNIDMMAMLTYKRHFLEGLFDQSLTKKLSYHSEIPLFALHEK